MEDTRVRLQRNARRVAWLARKGQRSISAKLVMALLVHPIVEVLEDMEQAKGQRWLTLKEAIRMSGRARNYFEKPLARRGGRSRLQIWKAEGLADQTEDGLWLISPLVVAEARRDACADDSALQREAEEIARRFAA